MTTSWFVPGRLEVFGKHTDYAGGRSLLAAVDHGITVSVADADAGITATTTASPGSVSLTPGVVNDQPAGHWSHYVQTVIDRLAANFSAPRPCVLTISSDLPLASGMSSSSALIVASALTLADHNGFTETEQWRANIAGRVDLAGYAACIENGQTFGTLAGHRGVGTFGGSEDHTAMLCCTPEELSSFRFCPIRLEERVAFPATLSFVVGVSGVLAEKTGAARDDYNRAALATAEIVQRWNADTGRDDAVLADALASSPDAIDRASRLVADDEDLTRRLVSYWTESEGLIPAAVNALRTGEFAHFGELATLSHQNADQGLRNQVPETNALVRIAGELGAIGASGFGAGFGGSVWALVPTAQADSFAAAWLQRYTAEFPDVSGRASTLVTRPGDAARRLSLPPGQN